jgi:hypothetical protein
VRSNLLSCRRSRAAHGGRFRGISNSGEYRTDKNQGPEVYRQRAAEDGYKSDEAASSSHSMIKKKRDPCCHGSLRSVRRNTRVLHLLSTVALRHQFRRFSVALCRTNATHRHVNNGGPARMCLVIQIHEFVDSSWHVCRYRKAQLLSRLHGNRKVMRPSALAQDDCEFLCLFYPGITGPPLSKSGCALGLRLCFLGSLRSVSRRGL